MKTDNTLPLSTESRRHMDLSVIHNRVRYEWDNDGLCWSNTRTHRVAPEGLKAEVQALFLAKAKELFAEVKDHPDDRAILYQTLLKMSTTVKQRFDIGFFQESVRDNPVGFFDLAFASFDSPHGRSFVNCPILRNRFFAKKTCCFSEPIHLVGTGPFSIEDLQTFATGHGIKLTGEEDRTHVLVVGRQGWEERDLDDIVDEAEGSVLQIYSQEMFISVLGGQPDPFKEVIKFERLRDLYAFRVGHPALEYVSQGWSGWVTGYRAHSSQKSLDIGRYLEHVEESPLHAMDYRVGQSGWDANTRRQILSSAFKEPLPFVEGLGYMEAWGEPGTGQRLHKMAMHIAYLVDKNSGRQSLGAAVRDWNDDLKWLKAEFYRGVFNFNWPQV